MVAGRYIMCSNSQVDDFVRDWVDCNSRRITADANEAYGNAEEVPGRSGKGDAGDRSKTI